MNLQYLRSALFPILLSTGFAHGHPSGSTKVSIRLLDHDSITVSVVAHHDDFTYTLPHNISFNFGTTIPSEVRDYQKMMESYELARVRLSVDDQPIDNLKILRWKPGGTGPDDDLTHDAKAFWIGSFTFTFEGKLPPRPRKNLAINVQMFAEFGFETTSEVSLYWHDTLLDHQWLGLDRTLREPISEDSLNARLQRSRFSGTMQTAHPQNLVAHFIGLGVTHILLNGLYSILFVLALFFFSIRMRFLLWQIAIFTLAHSIGLWLAMAGMFTLSSHIVCTLIALSIAIVGAGNIFFRRMQASRWLIVFGFGLIHGMGFAGALRGLALPPGKFWSVLAGFNFGVELDQLAVVTSAFLLTRWMWHKSWYFKRVTVPVSSIITCIALFWFVQRVVALR